MSGKGDEPKANSSTTIEDDFENERDLGDPLVRCKACQGLPKLGFNEIGALSVVSDALRARGHSGRFWKHSDCSPDTREPYNTVGEESCSVV